MSECVSKKWYINNLVLSPESKNILTLKEKKDIFLHLNMTYAKEILMFVKLKYI